jgi:predicted transcriptional regulator
VTPDYIVCLEDGQRVKMLKRYIMTHYNQTPAQYRAKWGLPPEYPMVAPNYAKRRSELAKAIGLGTKANSPKERAPRERRVGARA